MRGHEATAEAAVQADGVLVRVGLGPPVTASLRGGVGATVPIHLA